MTIEEKNKAVDLMIKADNAFEGGDLEWGRIFISMMTEKIHDEAQGDWETFLGLLSDVVKIRKERE